MDTSYDLPGGLSCSIFSRSIVLGTYDPEQPVAESIPEFKGKVSRLKKPWYPELLQNGKGLLSTIGLEGMPWWVIAIIVIVILKIFKAALPS